MGRWSNKNPHKQCLIEELKSILPDRILLMGNEAETKYNSIKSNLQKNNIIPVIVPHPSQANILSWQKLGIDTDPQDRADYILSFF